MSRKAFCDFCERETRPVNSRRYFVGIPGKLQLGRVQVTVILDREGHPTNQVDLCEECERQALAEAVKAGHTPWRDEDTP